MKPLELTLDDFLEVIGGLDETPPLFDAPRDLMPEGPRIVRSGLVPYALDDGEECHAIYWADGLMLVSPAVFDVLKG